nr:hypothetical protein [uncultured Romboutsia sp.]
MKKSKKIIIAIILIIMGTIGFLYLKNEYNKDFDGTSISGYVLGKGIAPDLTPEEIKALLQKEVDASKIAFSIYSEAIFNGKVGTIMFANPKYNAYDIDLEVKVDNKVIIRTEKIAPDQYIEKIELIGKALKKGKHKATGRIKAYDRKTGEVMGEVNVDITLISN